MPLSLVDPQLVDDFARYPYLPRLKTPSVLLGAIQEGVGMLTWEREGFAYADSFDEATERYRGLRGGHNVSIIDSASTGLLVKPDVARTQMDAERPPDIQPEPPENGFNSHDPRHQQLHEPPYTPPIVVAPSRPTRFHGTVTINAARVGLEASRIADEVIAHVTGLVGAKVTVTIEVEAEVPAGVPENVMRSVTENSRTLGFTSHGFERE